MGQYTMIVNATSNVSADTEDTFIEIDFPAGVSGRVKRVRVSTGATAAADNTIQVRLVSKTGGGATGVAGTELKKKDTMPAAVGVGTIKNGTAAFTTVTLGNIYDRQRVNQRAGYEWVYRDDIDPIEVPAGDIFAVLVEVSAASVLINCTVDWEE